VNDNHIHVEVGQEFDLLLGGGQQGELLIRTHQLDGMGIKGNDHRLAAHGPGALLDLVEQGLVAQVDAVKMPMVMTGLLNGWEIQLRL